jgi:hypothetical protein
LVHDSRSIYAFAAIEFCDTDDDLLTGFFDPGLVFGFETSEELKGDRKDFFSVGITSGIEAILNELFVLGGDRQHRYDDREGTFIVTTQAAQVEIELMGDIINCGSITNLFAAISVISLARRFQTLQLVGMVHVE